MNKKIKLGVYIIGFFILFVMLYVFQYRVFFGVWNPLENPDRINYHGHRYYISESLPIEIDKTQMTEVKWPDNKTFRQMYVDQPETFKNASAVYLLTKNDKYQKYSISGSID